MTTAPTNPRRKTRRAANAGFTLVEILVVIVIIGVIVSASTIAVGVLGRDRQIEDESRRFWAVVRQAREEAELQSLDAAVFVASGEYEFLRYDRRRQLWMSIVDDKLYAQRTLPEGLRFRLWVDGREVVLKPDLPNRSDKSEHEKWPPQIMVLSSGELMPFELHLERDAAPALWRVVALPDNDLRIERRDDQREWIMVQQTKEPPPEDREKERLSNARR
jgi:general secretion pathway protein H